MFCLLRIRYIRLRNELQDFNTTAQTYKGNGLQFQNFFLVNSEEKPLELYNYNVIQLLELHNPLVVMEKTAK